MRITILIKINTYIVPKMIKGFNFEDSIGERKLCKSRDDCELFEACMIYSVEGNKTEEYEEKYDPDHRAKLEAWYPTGICLPHEYCYI